METQTKSEKTFFFELLSGVHSEGLDANGGPRIYEPGDVIQTTRDLGLLNYPGMNPRYKEVEEPIVEPSLPREKTAKANPSGGWEAMTVAELRSLAAEEEIDLKDATKKNEIISLIRGVLS